MLTPGTYYVITTGKRYLRFPYKDKRSGFIVGNQLQHAHKFESQEEAVANAKLLDKEWKEHHAEGGDKPKLVSVQEVIIRDVPL
jgi:hypothetical protein